MHKRVRQRLNEYSWIEQIINPQFIESQQTHHKKELHQIDLQEHRGEHCIEDQKERRSHLGTKYGPVDLW